MVRGEMPEIHYWILALLDDEEGEDFEASELEVPKQNSPHTEFHHAGMWARLGYINTATHGWSCDPACSLMIGEYGWSSACLNKVSIRKGEHVPWKSTNCDAHLGKRLQLQGTVSMSQAVSGK